MEKNFYPITLLTVLLAVFAVGAYVWPQAEEDVPTRILLDKKGGKIVYEHKVHAEGYGLECSTCHHYENLENGVTACGECHNALTAEYDLPDRMEAFHLRCMGCHEEVGSGPYEQDQCNLCHLK